MKRDIRVLALGESERLSPPLRHALEQTVEMTANNRAE